MIDAQLVVACYHPQLLVAFIPLVATSSCLLSFLDAQLVVLFMSQQGEHNTPSFSRRHSLSHQVCNFKEEHAPPMKIQELWQQKLQKLGVQQTYHLLDFFQSDFIHFYPTFLMLMVNDGFFYGTLLHQILSTFSYKW